MRTWLVSIVLVVACGMTITGCFGERHRAAVPTSTVAPTTSTLTMGLARPARIGTSCPSRAPLRVPRHQRDGTTRTLVPGRPIALLACRYHGFNQSQPIGTFARAAELPASQIAHGLNATPRPPSDVVYNCPADFGETYMLFFSYQGGPSLSVAFADGGCRYVDNGDLRRPFPPIPVTMRLEAALGQDHL